MTNLRAVGLVPIKWCTITNYKIDTGYTNNSKQDQYKKKEKKSTRKSTWYLMVFVEVDGVVFLHLPRLLNLHPALLCRLLQHVQLLLDLF